MRVHKLITELKRLDRKAVVQIEVTQVDENTMELSGRHSSLLVTKRGQSFSPRWSVSPRPGQRLSPHGWRMLSGAT